MSQLEFFFMTLNLRYFKQSKNALLLILTVGLFFRLGRFTSFAFGFDQVQIVIAAQNILRGDLTLVGPRTGPANMFTGPLIYYLTAPLYLLFHEWSIVVGAVLVSLATGLSLFWLVQKYLNTKQALIITTIWALSPFIIQTERTFWNPSLTLLAASFCFFPLLSKKRASQFDLLLIVAGSFLGYQAHFSGLFLPLLVGLVVISYKKSWQLIFSALIGLTVSLLPTLLFDLRHDWLNMRGLLSLATDSGSELTLWLWLKDLIHNFQVSLENLGKLFLFGNQLDLLLLAGLVIIFLAWKNKNQRIFGQSLLWVGATALFFSFYPVGKPEYYFLITFPALFVINAQAFSSYTWQQLKFLAIGFLFFTSMVMGRKLWTDPGPSLVNLFRLQTVVEDLVINNRVSQIVYDINPQEYDVDGFKYFIDQLQLENKFQPDGKSLHLTYPNKYSFGEIKEIGDIGIWLDPRVAGKNYLTYPEFILSTPAEIKLLKNPYPQKINPEADLYEIFEDEQKAGELEIINVKQNKDHELVKACQQGGREAYFLSSGYCFYLNSQIGSLRKLIEVY